MNNNNKSNPQENISLEELEVLLIEGEQIKKKKKQLGKKLIMKNIKKN